MTVGVSSNVGGGPIVKRTALLLIAAAVSTLSACESDPVVMPDVQGMALDEARSQLDGLGLDVHAVDASPDRRLVLAESNWVVTGQSTAAGTEVDEEAAVDLEVLKKDDAAHGDASPAETSAAPSSQPEDDDSAALAYLQGQYADASWLPSITRVYSNVGALWVDTDLYPDSDAADPASAICTALSGYAIQRPTGFTGVSVRASDGQGLVNRTSLSDSCEAESLGD